MEATANIDHSLFLVRYSSCLRQEKGYCCVKFSSCADADSFSLSKVNAAGTVVSAATDSNCNSYDYVLIAGKGYSRRATM